MGLQIRNPAALRLFIGWIALSAITVGVLGLAGFLPPHPGFKLVFLPAMGALAFQGMAALSAGKRGWTRLGWIILLAPPLLLAVTGLLIYGFFTAGGH